MIRIRIGGGSPFFKRVVHYRAGQLLPISPASSNDLPRCCGPRRKGTRHADPRKPLPPGQSSRRAYADWRPLCSSPSQNNSPLPSFLSAATRPNGSTLIAIAAGQHSIIRRYASQNTSPVAFCPAPWYQSLAGGIIPGAVHGAATLWAYASIVPTDTSSTSRIFRPGRQGFARPAGRKCRSRWKAPAPVPDSEEIPAAGSSRSSGGCASRGRYAHDGSPVPTPVAGPATPAAGPTLGPHDLRRTPLPRPPAARSIRWPPPATWSGTSARLPAGSSARPRPT